MPTDSSGKPSVPVPGAEPLTLLQLNRRIGSALAAAPGMADVWVVAETSDVRCSGGHCYMELIEKDAAGRPAAKSRAVIWAGNYARLNARFAAATGTPLGSDMKVMVRATVNYHPVFGLSLVINDLNPEYTAGDLVRRRNEIIGRLRAEGVFDLNRTLGWPQVVQRVAVISARGAAGYGDFIKHLYTNPLRLRFHTELFEASLQGERTVPSIVAALEAIMEREADFDCVVIIRGGGAVSDLASFDDYTLASNVAQFPLPVVVGIGHDRDITVLDYVANAHVKTPTAAAELLIGMATAAYSGLLTLGREIYRTLTARIDGERHRLAYCCGQLPPLARTVLVRAAARLPQEPAETLQTLAANILDRQRRRLDAAAELLAALAPEATLRRGFSITRIGGHAVTDSRTLRPGDIITTVFAAGEPVESTVKTSLNNG